MTIIEVRLSGSESLKFVIPANWDEVPADTFPLLAETYLSAAKIDDARRSVAALALLCGDHWRQLSNLTEDNIYSLLPAVNWVFEKLDLSINKIPFVALTGPHEETIRLCGPESGLSNMRFAEWCAADTLFSEYTANNDINILNRFVAVLYREIGHSNECNPVNPHYRGDLRIKFNDSLLDHHQKLIATIPRSIKLAIYLWFSSCRHVLSKQYDEVFCSAKNEKPGKLESFGWFGVYDDLRGDPRFGGPDKLEEEFIHTVFASITRSQLKYRQFKKEHGL